MMYYFYSITNNTNNKKYYGVHKTKNIDDSYMGSGVAIKKAILKYGLDCFQKEILVFFNSDLEMYEYEKNFITADLVKNKDNYNLTIGGKGGFSHIDSKGSNNPMYGKGDMMREIQLRPDVIKKKSIKMTLFNNHRYENGYVNPIKNTNNYWNDVEKAATAKVKMSENHPDVCGMKNPFYGKKHSKETIQALSDIHSNRKKVDCPHCHKNGDVSNMTRWHFNNCKKKVL